MANMDRSIVRSYRLYCYHCQPWRRRGSHSRLYFHSHFCAYLYLNSCNQPHFHSYLHLYSHSYSYSYAYLHSCFFGELRPPDCPR